ncbi:MAG: helix-turn-helix transcriptional regulator [Spirochaetes bacterium]|nr:helix-turn-helix transcriptional regulator [Spirochaetota bacterium]
MTNLRHILALNIKERRRFLGMSQVKLAEKIDTAPTYIAMIELEKRSPSFEMIERIAAALNIDPPDLFSKKAYSVDLIKDFHESVLSDFEKVLNKQIIDFEKKINSAMCIKKDA